VAFNSYGTGPTINGLEPTRVGLAFMVGTNPFASTSDQADLILGSSIAGYRFGAQPADSGG